MEEAVRKLLEAATGEVAALGDDLKALEQLRVRYLGRKGEVAQLLSSWARFPKRIVRQSARC